MRTAKGTKSLERDRDYVRWEVSAADITVFPAAGQRHVGRLPLMPQEEALRITLAPKQLTFRCPLSPQRPQEEKKPPEQMTPPACRDSSHTGPLQTMEGVFHVHSLNFTLLPSCLRQNEDL